MHHHKRYVFIFTFFNYLDPVRLNGEGQYNLNNMKEIYVTDSFMGLERNTRNCQNLETYNDCITRHYIKMMMQECGCLPLSHVSSFKVTDSQINKCHFNSNPPTPTIPNQSVPIPGLRSYFQIRVILEVWDWLLAQCVSICYVCPSAQSCLNSSLGSHKNFISSSLSCIVMCVKSGFFVYDEKRCGVQPGYQHLEQDFMHEVFTKIIHII